MWYRILLLAFLFSFGSSAQDSVEIISCPAYQAPSLRVYWNSAALVKAELKVESDRIYFKPTFIYRDTLGQLGYDRFYPLIVEGKAEKEFIINKITSNSNFRLCIEWRNSNWHLENQFNAAFKWGRGLLFIEFDGKKHFFEQDKQLKEFLAAYHLDLTAHPKFDPSSKEGKSLLRNNPLIKAFEEADRNVFFSKELIYSAAEQDPVEQELIIKQLEIANAFPGGEQAFRAYIDSFPRQPFADQIGRFGLAVYELRYDANGKIIIVETIKSLPLIDGEARTHLLKANWIIPKAEGPVEYRIRVPFRYPEKD